jgi:hypothetical protein
MTRERERQWLLKWLQRRTLETALDVPGTAFEGYHAHLRNDPKARFHGELGFIPWVASLSLDDNWIKSKRWIDPKGWRYKRQLKKAPDEAQRKILYDKFWKERQHLYNSLIDECITMGYVLQAPFPVEGGDKLTTIRTSPTGDTYISQFWHKATWDNPIGTAFIIFLLTTLASIIISHSIAGAIKSPENQVYKIQIMPYETSTTQR